MKKQKTVLENNKEYRLNKSILLLEKKSAEKLKKRQLYLNKLRATALLKSQSSINNKFNKKIASFVKKTTKESQKKIKNIEREIKGHKIINYKVKPKGVKYWKKKAIDMFQLWIRLSKADSNWFVTLINGWEIRRYNWCDAGHLFPKSKWPHLIFYSNNVRPQWKYDNKIQGDSIGWWWYIVKDLIGNNEYKLLLATAENKELKFDTIKRQQNVKYWEDYYIEYKEKVEIEKKRLWI